MKAPSPDSSFSAEDEAALWAARLDGSSLTAADRAALEVWLERDPSHRTLLSQYCQFSADLEEQLPALVEAGRLQVPATAKRRTRRVAIAFASVALAAAAAVTIMVRSPQSQTQFENIATSVGKRETIVMADGTRVELNAQTSIAIEAGRAERRVRLASGEAFFSVSKDSSRPFVVETPAGSVRVTGTKFNVHTETNAAFDVTVVEGSVQVRPGELGSSPAPAPFSLGPRDQLSASGQGVSVAALSPSELEDRLAWRQGQIVADRISLSEVLSRVARYHGRGISASPDAGRLHLSGRYSLDDFDEFLSDLETVLPVQVTRDLSGTVRVSLRPTGAAPSR